MSTLAASPRTTSPRTASRTSAAPRGGTLRALRADAALHPWQVAASLALCVVAVVGAVLGQGAYTDWLALWAILGWVRMARADSLERLALLSSLGISRADRIRGRIAYLAIDGALLLAVSAAAGALGPTDAAENVSVLAWQTMSLIGGVLVWLVFAAMFAGITFERRPGRSLYAMALYVSVFTGIIIALAAVLPTTVVILALPSPLNGLAGVAILAVGAAIAALVLRRRVRGWIAATDSVRAGGAR